MHLPTLNKTLIRNKIFWSTIKDVYPLINIDNWYDKEKIEAISNSCSIYQGDVKKAIKLITSKEIGYYIYLFYEEELHATNKGQNGNRLDSSPTAFNQTGANNY